MPNFESATLWQNSLGKKINEDEHEKEREFFRTSLESFRKKALILAAEIAITMPDFTVHDITHIDALWEMASIICGEDYEINPAEAYVLGGAFLIHDLGMGLAAYPDGTSSLKETTVWNDTYSYINKNSKESKEVIEKQTLEIVLRALHAKQAEKLALISWGDDKGKEYLIDDTSLRDDYGAVIGKIAYSHWWDSSEIINNFPSKLGAIGTMPHHWQVDPVKLACIMRVADAAHIDSRRAPSFLRKLRKLPNFSEQHWLFQQKLYQPRIERDRLVYTSKSSFDVNEAASWWLCYDTLKMIDRELNSVDLILHGAGTKRFKAKGLANIDNFQSLVRLITTNGWTPVDARVHVGNVSKLVKNLGGSQLYGNNPFVAIRELVQNGCDAIRARRLLENDDESYGSITVRLDRDEDGLYIEVEDDGVGMSSSVLTGPFLDFGNSFWGTTQMHDQFPGLESKGYRSTGKFGVGFFSIFMISNKVKVITRRYEEGRSETRVLSFDNELLERPILRLASRDEYIKNGGTKVVAYIADERFYKKILRNRRGGNFENLGELMIHCFPSLDVDMFVEDNISGFKKKIICASDWTYLNGSDFLSRVLSKVKGEKGHGEDSNYYKRLETIDKFSKNIRPIIYQGKMVGRGYLIPSAYDYYPDSLSHGALTVGGFRTSYLKGCVGVFLGVTSTASRDSAHPAFPGELYQEWFEEQFLLIKDDLEPDEQVHIASKLRFAGLDIKDLFFCNNSHKHFTVESFTNEILKKYDEIKFLSSVYIKKTIASEGEDYPHVEYDENVICIDSSINFMLGAPDPESLSWPNNEQVEFLKSTLAGLLLELISDVWGITLTKFEDFSFDSSKTRDKTKVGTFLNKEYFLEASVISKSDFT